MELKKFAPYLLFIVFYVIFSSGCIFTSKCIDPDSVSDLSTFFIVVISVVLFIILAVSSHYNAKIKEKMLMRTVFIIGLMAVFFYIHMFFGGCTAFEGDSDFGLEQYSIACDCLCQRYIDADFAPAEALDYCEKYYEIDLNENGKIGGEVGRILAYGLEYGVSEDRVYCFTLTKCYLGSDRNSRLTPEKCRDIMCDVYTERLKGNETAAAASIKNKIPFGESTDSDHEDLIIVDDVNGNPIVDPDGKIISLASWWIDNFQDVDCSRE